jgi:hypothetical protein
MDEIALLRAIRPDAPEGFAEPERGEVLCRLLAAAAGERAAGKPIQTAGWLRRASWRWQLRVAGPPAMARRLGIAAAAAAATVATVALVLAVLPATAHAPAGARRIGPAARPGLGTQDLTARPDQFIYTEQLIEGEQYMSATRNGTHTVRVPPYQQRTWLSADGKRGIASSQRNLKGGTWSRVGGAESLCEPSAGKPSHQICFPGYLTSLPGTVAGMRSFLLRSGGPNGPAAYRLLSGIVSNSSASGLLVPNSGYALMYRAALTVKGVYRVPDATTIAGGAGIGVAACVPAAINKGSMSGFHGCSYRTELIFDARTYELIGVDHIAAPGRPALPGSPDSALLSIAVVNRIGRLP